MKVDGKGNKCKKRRNKKRAGTRDDKNIGQRRKVKTKQRVEKCEEE